MSLLEEAVAGQQERWRHCGTQAQATLLRLAILRDLSRELHARKSQLLATGRRDQAQSLKGFETRLEELRAWSRLEGDLTEVISSKEPGRKRTRLLPDPLIAALGAEKLNRYDRQWENVLAAEAAALGWRFWALDAWVEIPQIEDWNRRLGEQLWPAGVVLFTESASLPGTEPALSEGQVPLWQGRWIVITEARFATSAEIPFHPAGWPGNPSRPPSPPSWKLLFSPKAR